MLFPVHNAIRWRIYIFGNREKIGFDCFMHTLSKQLTRTKPNVRGGSWLYQSFSLYLGLVAQIVAL